MAVLHDLVATLHDAKIKRISTLVLPAREQQVLEFVISRRSSKLFPTSLALKKLDITQTHFEKICSVLTKKVVIALAGEDPYAQFKFIRELTARPARLLRHQMKASEKQIKDKEEFIKFYADCCEAVTRFGTTDMDEREISHYTGKLITLIDPASHPERYIKIKCDELYAIIGMAVLNLGIEDDSTRKRLSAKIIRLDKESQALGHPMGRYQVLRIASMFFTSIDDQDIALTYAAENIALTDQYESIFSAREWLEPRLMQAECLSYMSRFRESFDIFCSLIRHSKYNIHHVRLATQARFLKIALTLGEYATAKSIIDSNFTAACENENSDLRIMAYLQCICYHMHIGDTAKASQLLIKARQIINRQRQQQYNIQLLFFENAYPYLIGEYEEASILVQKNIKFLRSKNINRSSSGYPALFSAIQHIYDQRLSGRPFTPRQQKDFDHCFRESFSHFGGILQRMKEMHSLTREKNSAILTSSEN